MTSVTVTGAARTKPNLMQGLLVSGGILAGLFGLGWAGLQVRPAPFAAVPPPPTPPETVPLPGGLPAPVERFYRQIYGERVPVIKTAVISGRGTMRPVGGITFPARFRFTHVAGQSYRHYFETTLFGLPIMKVNEHYVNGKGHMELPWGITEGEQIDQGGNLALWAESIYLPAIWLTDPRVHWEPVDDVTALLVVPFGQAQERVVVRFDPASGMPWLLESMRYKDASGKKTLWLNEVRAYRTLGGQMIPTVCAITWGDDGTPWLVFTIEDVVYNVDVDTSLAAKGP